MKWKAVLSFKIPLVFQAADGVRIALKFVPVKTGADVNPTRENAYAHQDGKAFIVKINVETNFLAQNVLKNASVL